MCITLQISANTRSRKTRVVSKLWLNKQCFCIAVFISISTSLNICKTNYMAHGTRGSILHSQGLSNNPYPEPN